jgi:hypothetical protein
MKNWLKKIKKNFEARLENLAEANRNAYGGRKLDCCTINRQHDQKIRNSKSKNITRQN